MRGEREEKDRTEQEEKERREKEKNERKEKKRNIGQREGEKEEKGGKRGREK